jgi:hexosaminidase
MLDTSRRFFPVKTIKEMIDIMALSKFNAFHWHLLDDDSFPMEVLGNPNLNKYGAFSAKETYSVDDMKDIVSYA